MKRTKIVCTIGPSSEEVETLKELIINGMNVARLNFSHGSYEEHAKRINNIRKAAKELKTEIAIMLDTKGPEIRIGEISEGKVSLITGKEIILSVKECLGNEDRVQVSYPGLVDEVNIGDSILIDDGLVELKVLHISYDEIKCIVINGGEISSRKGVNIPGVEINLPTLTDKDVADLHFGVEQGVDFIAASFIRKASDILVIKEILKAKGANIDVIAKIENQSGVNNIEEIISVADGIMVARGDLGVEIPTEEVPLVQKMIVNKCSSRGKPVIIATQMLDSMMKNPRPTRAEASDVANAVFDGADAIMLSGETAAGKYPVESVKIMTKIALKTEESLCDRERIIEENNINKTITDAMGQITWKLDNELGVAAIITCTQSGSTAKAISKYRPKGIIIAVTPSREVVRKLQLIWGVKPILSAEIDNTDEVVQEAVAQSLSTGLIKNGDTVIITAGVPVGIPGTTNLLKVHVVGGILAEGIGIGNGVVRGKVIWARTGEEAKEKVENGSILVTRMTDKDYIPAMEKAAAIITEIGGLTSHASIVGLNLGKPVVIGVGENISKLKENLPITIDVNKGLIYEGFTKVV